MNNSKQSENLPKLDPYKWMANEMKEEDRA